MTTPAQELAEKILDQIDKHPESHDQNSWGEYDECRTTACVAGWAALLTGNAKYESCHPYSPEVGGFLKITSPKHELFRDLGADLLGLSDFDSLILFHQTTNEQAKEALKYIAKGEGIPWSDILEK